MVQRGKYLPSHRTACTATQHTTPLCFGAHVHEEFKPRSIYFANSATATCVHGAPSKQGSNRAVVTGTLLVWCCWHVPPVLQAAIISKIMALPPLMSAAALLEHGAVATAGLRALFGGTPNSGNPAAYHTFAALCCLYSPYLPEYHD